MPSDVIWDVKREKNDFGKKADVRELRVACVKNTTAFSCIHTSSDFCRQGLAMRSLVGVLTTGCLDSKLGFLPLHTNILEAKY